MPHPRPIPFSAVLERENPPRSRKAVTRRFAAISAAVATAALFVAPPLHAQMHRVEQPERVTRAVGVYEWTGSLEKPTAARLIPVSLFIDAHLEDAGVYLARPVPFALQSGIVYSIETAGKSEGLLDLDSARDVVDGRAKADDDPLGTWYAYGTFQTPSAAPHPKALPASTHTATVVASNDDDDKPHFVTRPGATDTSSPSATKGSSAPAAPSSPPAADDPDRPHMSRAPGSGSDSSTTSTGSGTSTGSASTADTDTERPTLRRRDAATGGNKKNKRGSDSGVIPVGTSLNEDPDRPTMRRGHAPGAEDSQQLAGLPAGMHQAVAVSDAANRDPHVFAREWESPEERTTTLADLEKLARQGVTEYEKANRLTPGVPGPAVPDGTINPADQNGTETGNAPLLRRGVPKDYSTRPAAASHPKAAASPIKAAPGGQISFADEQLTPLTLSYGGLPTFVYTAQSPVTIGGPVYVTVVAQRLPSGELQVSLHSVTDATHLNRVPWMRFVDAVDPDASHRASLLFELRAQGSRQFALYRLVSVQAEQTLLTGLIE